MAHSVLFSLPDGRCIPMLTEDVHHELMRTQVEPELARLRTEKEIPVSGGTLHAENYIVPGAKRALIMLHGYTESAEKLRELAWYFIQAGYSVFSYDHRGHAHSLRQLEDHTVAYIEHFRTMWMTWRPSS